LEYNKLFLERWIGILYNHSRPYDLEAQTSGLLAENIDDLWEEKWEGQCFMSSDGAF
jgi:hypothetical protein